MLQLKTSLGCCCNCRDQVINGIIHVQLASVQLEELLQECAGLLPWLEQAGFFRAHPWCNMHHCAAAREALLDSQIAAQKQETEAAMATLREASREMEAIQFEKHLGGWIRLWGESTSR